MNRVAIAGVDEAVEPKELAALSDEFPFVEWSILCDGEPKPLRRFSSEAWIYQLTEILRTWKIPLNLLLHLCRKVEGGLRRENLRTCVSWRLSKVCKREMMNMFSGVDGTSIKWPNGDVRWQIVR